MNNQSSRYSRYSRNSFGFWNQSNYESDHLKLHGIPVGAATTATSGARSSFQWFLFAIMGSYSMSTFRKYLRERAIGRF